MALTRVCVYKNLFLILTSSKGIRKKGRLGRERPLVPVLPQLLRIARNYCGCSVTNEFDVPYLSVMETKDLQPRRMQQLRLFPDADDDAAIYRMSETYRKLDETGQKVVQGYLVALDRAGDLPSQAKIAEAANLGRSTVSEKLKDDGKAIMAAVTEIIAMTRDDEARRSSIAIPKLASLIFWQFVPAEGKLARDTRTLTKVELEVLKLSSMMGGVIFAPDGGSASLTLGTRVNADGTTETAVKLSTGESPMPNVNLPSIIKSLVDGQRQRIADSEQETPNVVRGEEDT